MFVSCLVLQQEISIDAPAGLTGPEQAQLVGVEVVQAEELRGEIDIVRGERPVLIEQVVDVVPGAAPGRGEVLHAPAFLGQVSAQVGADACDGAGHPDRPATGGHAVVGVLAARGHAASLIRPITSAFAVRFGTALPICLVISVALPAKS